MSVRRTLTVPVCFQLLFAVMVSLRLAFCVLQMRLVATPVSCGGDQGSATSAITHSLQKDKTKCLDTSVFETVCPRPSLMGELYIEHAMSQ